MAQVQRSGVTAMPGIAISIFVFAVGAIVRYAITQTTPGFDLQTGGVILMFVGGAGVLLSLLVWSSLSPFRHGSTTRRETTSSRGGRGRETVVSETEVSDG